MLNPSRDQLRRQIEGALERIDGLRTTPSERHLTPVIVAAAAPRSRHARRSIRPIRAWDRLVRI